MQFRIPISLRNWDIHIVRVLIIFGVLLASFGLASRIVWEKDWNRFLIIPGGFALLIFSVWLLKRLHLGVLLVVVAALLIPFSLETGTQSDINAAVLALIYIFALWLFDRLILKRELIIRWVRPVVAMVMLSLAATLSFLLGQIDWFFFAGHAPITSQLGGLGLFYLTAIAFLLPSLLSIDVVWLNRMTWLFVCMGGVFVFSTIVPGARDIGKFFNEGSSGSAFWIWIIAIPLSQGLANTSLGWKSRWLLSISGIGIMLSRLIYNRDWVSGWLPPLTAILIVLVLAKPWLGFGGMVFSGILGVRYFKTFLGSLSIDSVGGEDYSFLTRIEAWQSMAQIVKANPISGFGPANYYFYTPLAPLRGLYLRFNSHNQYVDMIAQTGIIGLGIFIWLAVEIGKLGWRLMKKFQPGFERAYAIGALGGLGGMLISGMLGDWIIPFVYNIGLSGFQSSVFGWLFLGGLLALDQIASSKVSLGQS